MSRHEEFDLAIVGAGIVGLAAAIRRDLRVVVIDRDAQANGASVRNFGFVTVSGQNAGRCGTGRCDPVTSGWRWPDPRASGHPAARLLLLAGRKRSVVEAFLQTEMGEGVRCLSPMTSAAVPATWPRFRWRSWSRTKCVVESREAIRQLGLSP